MYWQKDKIFKIAVSIFVAFGIAVPIYDANTANASDSAQVNSKPRKSQMTLGEQPVTNGKTDVKSHADGASASSDSQVLKQEYAPDRVIVKYKSNVSISALSSPYAAEQVAESRPLTQTGIQMLHLKDGTDINKVIAELKNDANVEYAEPDYKIYPANIPEKSEVKMNTGQVLEQSANTPKPFTPNDPFFNEQWGLNNTGQTLHNGDAPAGTPDIDINAPEAWAITQGSEDLIVAVIDSGVQTTLPDLYPNIWRNTQTDPQKNNQDINGWDFVHNDGSLFDIKDKLSDYHGTWLASIIAARSNNFYGIAGVAPHVKIMPLKVMTDIGYIEDVIKAIDYAQSHGAKIANIGWFTPGYSQALRDAIEHSSLLFVSAAGDHDGLNTDIIPVYPADFKSPNVLSVTGVDRGGNLAPNAAFGKSSVEVAAPGDYVITESPSNKIGYSAEIHKYEGPTNKEYKAIFNGVGFEEVPIREDLGMDPKQRQKMFDAAMDYLNQSRGGNGTKVLLVQDDNVGYGGGDIGPFAADDTLQIYKDLLNSYKLSHPTLSYDISSTADQKVDGPDNTVLNQYDVVIWFTGYRAPISPDVFLTKNDQDNLTAYLNNGGHLLLTGQDAIDKISESSFVSDTLHLVLMGEGINGNPNAYPVQGTIYGGYKPFQLWDFSLFADLVASNDPWITQVDIEWPNGYYRYKTGTDMAAAFATGTAALVLSQYPDMDAAAVKSKLMNSGKPLSALNGTTVSGRMIDAFRAVWDKDIPGTPLQDATVTDKLDAATNPDKVYALDLNAGEQISLSLTADAGTDFDLELYDSSATTVASKAGIVASSEHPGTSNETITYVVPKAGTYYVDVYAYAGSGTFTLSKLSRNLLGTFEDKDKSLQYTGPWTSAASPSYSGGTSMQLDAVGRVELGFKGNTIEWIGSKGVNYGIADVYIDDIKVASPSLYSETPLTQQSLFKQSLGSNGRHTIKIQWTGQHDKSSKKSDDATIDIDKLIVSNLIASFDDSVSYQGIWGSGYSQKFTGGMQKFSVEQNSSVEFSFTGTRVALLANTGPGYGKAQIYIDDKLVTSDPVDWYSSKAKYQVPVFVSPSLASGDHKIKVVSIGQKNARSTGTVITIDAINVLN
ncbi:Subtilase family protein [Paenibacillus sp. yr247]|uniref:S8 family serine peptidase n=1 Tax=Paenibacillus sp. yr247 TaxID=1761880 RepID=UPI0008903FD0|nr:S8 family serine peptidase [Paenibacillus sp. yr247]SDO24882.1 Subtilase family protein [Paenibacillus sp. yr247]